LIKENQYFSLEKEIERKASRKTASAGKTSERIINRCTIIVHLNINMIIKYSDRR
jgi:hypothetical protein